MTTIFLDILKMSLTASYCIVIVCILRLFLKHVPKSFSYLLWIAVAFRLVCPITFDSPFSLLDTGIYHTVSDYIYSTTIIPASSMQNIISGNYDEQAESDYKYENTFVNMKHESASSESTLSKDININEYNFSATTIFSLLNIIWLAVAIAICGYNAFSYIYFKHRLVKTRKLMETTYDAKYTCTKKYTIYTISGISTSFVMGTFKPVIYVPDNLTASQTRVCIAHEITHIRRYDYIVKFLASLLVCIHWFNPLVWLAYKLMSMDMEQSCDEITLKNSDLDEKKEYSKALLSIAMLKNRNYVFSGYKLGFADDSSKSRIKNILNYKKPCIAVSVLCAAVVIICIAGLSVNPKANDNNLVEISENTGNSSNAYLLSEQNTAIQNDATIDAQKEAEIAEIQKKAEEAALVQNEEAALAQKEAELAEAQKKAEKTAHAQKEALELEELMTKFYVAYFSGDTDTIKSLMVDDYKSNPIMNDNLDVYDTDKLSDIEIRQIKGLANIDEENLYEPHNLSLELFMPNDDSLTYLTAELVNEDSSWKIDWYGLEK
jgi:beta-lactamase regulating signal transducer with metallopeptidase domain